MSSNRPKVITRNFAFSNFTNVHFLVQNLFIKVTRVICLVGVIAQTRETVFHGDIQTSRRELKIRRTAEYGIFDEIRGVWIADQTLSRVFDYVFSIETKTKE